MTKHDPLYPTPYLNSDSSTDYLQGITKREHFALEIFKALQANAHPDNLPNEPSVKYNIELAIKSADQFLFELNAGGGI